jgi:hypothetical protein
MTDTVKMTQAEAIARRLCGFDGGDPDTSFGGAKQSWLWLEYQLQAQGMIDAGYALVPVADVERLAELEISLGDPLAFWSDQYIKSERKRCAAVVRNFPNANDIDGIIAAIEAGGEG